MEESTTEALSERESLELPSARDSLFLNRPIARDSLDASVAGIYVALIDSASTEDSKHLCFRKNDVIEVIGEDPQWARYLGRKLSNEEDGKG